jgi:hypothetical protein
VEAVAVTNDNIQAALSFTEPQAPLERPEIVPPPLDTVFDLPCGVVIPNGELVKEVEVKELTGSDEEALAKATNLPKLLTTALLRGTVRVGGEKPSENLVNSMFSGDRDYILLRIYAATFGGEVETQRFCTSCQTDVPLKFDILEKTEVKSISLEDTVFTVETSKGPAVVTLPTGFTQNALLSETNKTLAELKTLLLEQTVLKIGNTELLIDKKRAVLGLSIKDRQAIDKELAARQFGPKLQDIKVECPNCGADMEVPLSVAGLFQF